jgi:hypothetical protein
MNFDRCCFQIDWQDYNFLTVILVFFSENTTHYLGNFVVFGAALHTTLRSQSLKILKI